MLPLDWQRALVISPWTKGPNSKNMGDAIPTSSLQLAVNFWGTLLQNLLPALGQFLIMQKHCQPPLGKRGEVSLL
jgi:hypothetical protein